MLCYACVKDQWSLWSTTKYQIQNIKINDSGQKKKKTQKKNFKVVQLKKKGLFEDCSNTWAIKLCKLCMCHVYKIENKFNSPMNPKANLKYHKIQRSSKEDAYKRNLSQVCWFMLCV